MKFLKNLGVKPLKNNKIYSLIGFAIKARLVRVGMDNITKICDVCLYSKSLSENAKSKLGNLHGIKSYEVDQEIFTNFFNESVNIVSIIKSELSKSISNLLEEK